ncbi:MAG TPA: hypothetical protein VK936_13270 [Longimicrobiales bacterium]|nr:hypothetical protein [Longimicrobiales bacterium]
MMPGKRPSLRSVTLLLATALAACEAGPTEPFEATRPEAVVLPTDTRLFVGDFVTCGTLDAGETYCWGETNAVGGLGIGHSWAAVPRPLSRDIRFAQVAPGHGHSCGLDTAGRAWCWGLNDNGQLGDGTTTNHTEPRPVKSSRRFIAIDVGSHFTCAIADFGRIYCWGSNGSGQLGIGSTDANRLTPSPITSGFRDFTAVTTGSQHACALRSANRTYCWGANSAGQLGRGTTSSPQRTPARTDTRALATVSAGDLFTCGVATTGGVFCWGQNSFGQMGRGTTSANQLRPAQVLGSSGFTDVAAGASHACALDADGAPLCWGRNDRGQLGTGFGNVVAQPSPVIGSFQFVRIGAGSHSCGLRSNGSAVCWGQTQLLGAGGMTSTPSLATEVLSPF